MNLDSACSTLLPLDFLKNNPDARFSCLYFYSCLYFCHSLNRLQRSLSAIAELLVRYGLEKQNIPFETDKVEIVVFLRQEVTKNTRRISAAYLICRESKIDTLCEVPQLCHRIVSETPATSHIAVQI